MKTATIHVRLTEAQQAKFHQLGGSAWIRAQIDAATEDDATKRELWKRINEYDTASGQAKTRAHDALSKAIESL